MAKRQGIGHAAGAVRVTPAANYPASGTVQGNQCAETDDMSTQQSKQSLGCSLVPFDSILVRLILPSLTACPLILSSWEILYPSLAVVVAFFGAGVGFFHGAVLR